MTYGDLQFFDLILFAGIAVFLIYRLRNVLGKRTGHQGPIKTKEDLTKEIKENVKKIPQLKDSETKLSKVYEVMEGFDHKAFLEGAKFAFETIINAFNSGDKTTLKTLLTDKVYKLFNEAINDSKNNPNYEFYSLVVDGVEDVLVKEESIYITLKITSEQFKENNEDLITKKQDVWTFEKKIKDTTPQWFLSST